MTANGTVATRDGYEVAQQAAALAIRPGQEFWTDKQRSALAVLGIKGATNADLAVFMHYCQKTGLDPFSRQIYMINRREKQGDQWVDKQTIQVGIGGFQVIRDRIAARLGIEVEYEDTIWYDADGGEHTVWLWDHAPAAAKVVVLKNGKRYPGVCRTASYMQRNKQGDPAGQWRTQPDHMIEKCAEAFALRRAFPHDLGGIYTDDEMPAQGEAAPVYQRVTAAEITGRQPVRATVEHEPPADAGPAAQTAAPKPAGRPAGKAALDSLNALTGLLDLSEEQVTKLVHWIAGPAYSATATEVKNVVSFLEDHLKAADGDTDKASAAIWVQYGEAGNG